MKRVLVVYFSQSGQLTNIVRSMVAPLQANAAMQVTMAEIQPVKPYPFPWPFWNFFNHFPECIHHDPKPILPLAIPYETQFDLIILAYQVWFLAPSMPMTAFLQSEQAKRLLKGKRIVTVIGCRNMWLQAQEYVKQQLQLLGARLVDNIVFTDRAHVAATFISTPMWLFTGKRGPFFGGLIPAAGVPESDIKGAARFGKAIAQELAQRADDDDRSMVKGLGAVVINVNMIASEAITSRSLRMWGRLLRALGTQRSLPRQIFLGFYILFLVTLILTVMPIAAVIKRVVAPLSRARVAQQRIFLAAPSGESRELVEPQA